MTRGRGKLTPQDIEYMKTISLNINRLLNEQNKKQIDIAREAKIPPSTLTGYIKGTSLPIPGNVQKIADFFGVLKSDIDPRFKSKQDYYSINNPQFNDVLALHKNLTVDRHGVWIQHGNKLLEEQEREKQKQEAPEKQVTKLGDATQQLFDYDFYDSAVSAGTGQFLNEAKRETISLPINLPADFVIPVYGNSMEPEYHSGDYVFVKLTVDIASGDVGIFDLCGESYIKKIIIDDDKAYLHSLNSEYKDIPITTDSDFRVIGKVIGKYSEK